MHYIVKFKHDASGHSGWTHVEINSLNNITGIEVLEITGGPSATAELAWQDHYRRLGMLNQENPEPAHKVRDDAV